MYGVLFLHTWYQAIPGRVAITSAVHAFITLEAEEQEGKPSGNIRTPRRVTITSAVHTGLMLLAAEEQEEKPCALTPHPTLFNPGRVAITSALKTF